MAYQLNLFLNNINMLKNKQDTVKDETRKDEVLVKWLDFLNHGWPSYKYEVRDLKNYW